MDGPRLLAEWRHGQKLSFASAAAGLKVSHVAWIEWERGSRHPTFTHAVAIEKLTGGAVRVEHWGWADELREIRALFARRTIASTGTDG